MFRNYLLVAFRNFRRNKLLTVIHLVGLSIGMAVCILIAFFIQDEFHRSHFHSKGDRVFRVLRESEMARGKRKVETETSSAISPAMLREFPEIEAAARLLTWQLWVRHGNKNFSRKVSLGDPAILEMFDIQLAVGDLATSLAEPNTMLITHESAKIYFGNDNPIGKTIEVTHNRLGGTYQITGVIQDMSPYSLIKFDFLTAQPPTEAGSGFKAQFDTWQPSWRPFRNYIMLREGISQSHLEAKLPEFVTRYWGNSEGAVSRYLLQPVNRIRLYSEVDYGLKTVRGIHFIYWMGLIGILILLVACINFMNLATAQSFQRAREVGLRKVFGADRIDLVRQFLGEAILLSFGALLLAYSVSDLALPSFNAFMKMNVESAYSLTLLATMLGLVLVVGVISGSYPAFIISRFLPVETLKGRLTTRTSARILRKSLVVVQFAVSSILITAAVIVYQQTEYIADGDLGYNKDLLVRIPIFGVHLDASPNSVKQAFLRNPGVVNGTLAWPPPGGFNIVEYQSVRPEGAAENQWQVIHADENFVDTFGIALVAGKNLSSVNDGHQEFLLNETAVRQLGWDDPIGKRFVWRDKTGTVVGVVRDFHTQSLHSVIEPVVIRGGTASALVLKINEHDIPSTLDQLKLTWQHLLPDLPFDYWFLDQNLSLSYWAEEELKETCVVFSLLATLVACLGLFGLAVFSAEQRTKEIGIRKTLGATFSDILTLLFRDFIMLITIANLIAGPFAYYLMKRWLENFPYRINLSPSPFLLCIGATLIAALLTVSYQSTKAALANPVDALRNE